MINIISNKQLDIFEYVKKKYSYIEDEIIIYVYTQTWKLLEVIPHKYRQVIELFNNKIEFEKFMIVNKLDEYIPTHYTSKNIKYPCIIKPSIGTSGHNVYIIKNKNDINQIKIKNVILSNSYVIQEYIESNYFYVCHLLCNNGEIIIGKTYISQKHKSFEILNGVVKNYTSRDVTHEEKHVFEEILKNVNYCGMCCIDYDYNYCNKIKIFEINPRFGGSLISNNDDLLLFLETIIINKISFNI